MQILRKFEKILFHWKGSWYFRRAFPADLGHERHKYIDVNWLFLNKSSSLNKSDEPFLDFRDFLETCTIHFKMHELDVTARILHWMSLGLLKLNFDLEWDLINVPAFSALVNYRSFKRPNCHYFNITAHIDSTLADTLISEQILQKYKSSIWRDFHFEVFYTSGNQLVYDSWLIINVIFSRTFLWN